MTTKPLHEPGHRLPSLDRALLAILGWRLRMAIGGERPETLTERLAAIEPQATESWRELLAHAHRHGVEAIVLDALGQAAIAVPAPVLREARGQAMARRTAMRLMLDAMRTAHKALTDAGCEPIWLKGPLLCEAVWDPLLGTPAGDRGVARGSSDLDLLVLPHEMATADGVLRELGYAPPEDVDRREPDVPYRDARGVTIELHREATAAWGLVPRVEALFSRAQIVSSELVSADVRRLNPADEWRFLALHAVKHGAERLAWLVDLAAYPTRPATSAPHVGLRRVERLTHALLARDLGLSAPPRCDSAATRLRLRLLDTSRSAGRNSLRQRIARRLLAISIRPHIRRPRS